MCFHFDLRQNGELTEDEAGENLTDLLPEIAPPNSNRIPGGTAASAYLG
jgi:hypothetical protein